MYTGIDDWKIFKWEEMLGAIIGDIIGSVYEKENPAYLLLDANLKMILKEFNSMTIGSENDSV